eukprot:scaffold120975_cov66-Phaeocystis_antarctica.AAC.9
MHLLCAYRDDARLLEEILVHARADDVALGVDEDLDELAEARRVVVARRLGVAEGLEHRVGLQGGAGEVRELLHHLYRATPLMPCNTPHAVLHPLTCRMASARVSMPPPLLERHAR